MLIASIMIFQILFFAGLIFMLRRILTQNVVSATRHLEELNCNYTKKEEEVNRLLEEAKQKSQELLSKTQKDAEAFKTKTIKEAQDESDKILKTARTQSEGMMQQAEKSRQQLLSEMDKRIEREAAVKASELIQQTLPDEFKQVVHKHWVEDLIENGFSRTERLHLPESLSEVRVISAFALTEDQRKKISKKLKDSMDREFVLKEEVDPNLVAGLVVVIGSLVLDGSFKNKIQEKTR